MWYNFACIFAENNGHKGKPVFRDMMKLVYAESLLEKQQFQAWEVLTWQGEIKEIYENLGNAVVLLHGSFRNNGLSDVHVTVPVTMLEKIA